MDKELKAKWVEALRSGKYEQGKRLLRAGERGAERYCCLGLLREVIAPGATYTNEMTSYLYPEHKAGLTDVQMDVLGNVMNDKEGKSFSEIADYIEKNL